MNDQELVETIQEMAEEQERESALTYANSLATWLETHDELTTAQREKAEDILEELED